MDVCLKQISSSDIFAAGSDPDPGGHNSGGRIRGTLSVGCIRWWWPENWAFGKELTVCAKALVQE